MFLSLCYKCKLTLADLEIMTIGMCFDYIYEYLGLEDKEPKVRRATQEDFDSF